MRRIVPSPSSPSRRSLPGIRNPKVILALLTALNLLNYLDRTVLPAVLAPVQDDLHLSNFVAGWLPTIFLIGYFATSPVFGTLGDRGRTGARMRLIAFGIAVWSAATMASGLAHSATQMIVARAFVGLGEASYATLAPTLIDDLAPPTQRSRWMAIFYSATPIGSALGYLVGGAVLHTHGWRAAFYVAGGPGLAIAMLCLLVVDPAEAASGARARPTDNPGNAGSKGRGTGGTDASKPAGALARTAKELALIPLYRGTVLGYCAYSFALGGFAYWAPVYLHRRYGTEPGHASVVFGLITVATGLAGTLLGGWLADRATTSQLNRARSRQTDPTGQSQTGETSETRPRAAGDLAPRAVDDATARGNVLVPALGALIGAPLAAVAIASGTASGFYSALFPAEIALFMMSGPINVAILRSAPPALRASAMALSIFAIHALGDLWSPPLIGLAADWAAARGLETGMQLAMYACPVVFAVAAVVWWKTARSSPRLT